MNKNKLKNQIYNELFEQVPINIAVIDRKHNIILANKNFKNKFGNWKEKKCYAVYKNQENPCQKCMAALTFEDGHPHVDDELGKDRKGKSARYVLHTAPVKNTDGTIPYVIKMSTDVTEIKHLQKK